MKDKKKASLVKRIATGVCALVLAVSCMGSVPYYASDMPPVDVQTFLRACGLPELPEYNPSSRYFVMDLVRDKGNHMIQCFEIKSGELNFFYYDSSYSFGRTFGWKVVSEIKYVNHTLNYTDSTHDIEWTSSKEFTDSNKASISSFSGSVDNAKFFYSDFDIYADSELSSVVHPSGIYQVYDMGFVESVPIGEYSSSIGYLQDISLKQLYLNSGGAAYNSETCKNVWSFSNTSTSGVDISDGSYSIRHYQQITIRSTSIVNPVVKEYDMVLMGEYPAANGRFDYMSMDYSALLEEKSAFEPLSFWDSTILGHYPHTVDYFQLVKTNADGSVEYGGYVKSELRGSPGQNDFSIIEYGLTTYTSEFDIDYSGYVDRDLPIVHGTANDYEDAEDKADNNLPSSGSSGGSSSGSNDMITQVDNLISVVMVVPRLISELFSFLPSWCLDFVGVAFALSMAILVFKLAN